jgi:predicted secreted Zn-dependent protease
MRHFLITLALCLTACTSQPHLSVGPVPAGVNVDARLQYYDVSAATLGDIQRAMAREGVRVNGRTWSAVTNWRVTWASQFNPRGVAGCEITRVKVDVRAIVTFPRWNPTAHPDSALLAWWEQFNSGLAEHERGHALIAVAAGRDIARALQGLSGGLCDALGVRANEIGRRVLAEARRKQEEYDNDTRHGATQIRQAGRLREP